MIKNVKILINLLKPILSSIHHYCTLFHNYDDSFIQVVAQYFQSVIKNLSGSKTSEVLIGKNGISCLHLRALGLWPINLHFSNKFPRGPLWLLTFENYCFSPSVWKTHCSPLGLSLPPTGHSLSPDNLNSNTWILP